MKAICVEKLFVYIKNNRFFSMEEGEVVNYTVKNKRFVIKGVELLPDLFYAHFKVIKGEEKMCYSDFEYILCNYVFKDAVLFPKEYSGVRHLIIQLCTSVTIMITINKEENVIRVSFDDKQEIYQNYEDALKGIRNYKRK